MSVSSVGASAPPPHHTPPVKHESTRKESLKDSEPKHADAKPAPHKVDVKA
jgi:hypothetical protein